MDCLHTSKNILLYESECKLLNTNLSECVLITTTYVALSKVAES